MICDMTEQLLFVKEIFTKLWFLPHCLSGEKEKSMKQAKINREKKDKYKLCIHLLHSQRISLVQ